MIFAITSLPVDYSIDKPRYVSMFHNRYRWGVQDGYKDMGWMFYVTFCAIIFKNKVFWFFLTTAAVYCFSYFVFANRYFEKKNIYFLIMTMGCLGFVNYATNTIHAGFAIAILILGLASKKKVLMIALLIGSIALHMSMIIPVAGFVAAMIVSEKKWFYAFWTLCFVLAVVNVDMSPFMDLISPIDNRVEYYSETMNRQFSSYKIGFRWDFLIYSVMPLFISTHLVRKHHIEDAFLSKITNMYVFANAVWLLAIRIAFTDRIAYLSWFLIPFITLYPVIKYQEKFNNPNLLVLGITGLFLGLNFVLMVV